ncbi:hypothetical protein ACFYW8_10915 [Streptomyces sp. NPDC002742]|uniref:hypothetical protein n=1 Tax=Streptomyces sp. NPDC002742 TaxID=3364663 RepID=UPI0036CE6D4A
MGQRLVAAVHVRHPKTNDWLILQPGDEPDEDLAEVITNPGAWEPDEEDGGDADPPASNPGPDSASNLHPEPQPEVEVEQTKPARARTRKQAGE